MRRRILVSAFWLGIFGLAGTSALVVKTVQAYTGVCYKLDGFPGLLQKAGFVPGGRCQDRHPCRGTCEIGDSGQRGVCTPVGSKQQNCVCKHVRESR
jgi:hypothetical protein